MNKKLSSLEKQEHKAYETELDHINTNEPEKEETIPNVQSNKSKSKKHVSLIRLYLHLSNPCEKVLMILGVISSIAAGLTYPLLCYLLGRTISTFSESASSNTKDMTPEEYEKLMLSFKDASKDMVDLFLYIGIGVFFANCFMNAIWNYVGLIQMHHLKHNYFSIILSQEQSWFDNSNAFEYATKIQAQLEQIEGGLGEKFGQLLELIVKSLGGLIIGFWSSWSLTLITLVLSPFTIGCVVYLLHALKIISILGRKTYEAAGGIAEEVLYNIKTVASFANFDFESKRFHSAVDQVNAFDQNKALKIGLASSGMLLFIYYSFCVSIVYAKKMIADKEINTNTNKPFIGGDVITVNYSTNLCLWAIGSIVPIIKALSEACTASSDYFELLDRKPIKRKVSNTIQPDKNSIKGKIDFVNVGFSYDKTSQVLNGVKLSIEAGKKVAFVGESGCGKSTLVNLLERMYEIDQGAILLDDIPIQHYDMKYLRSLIGYVQQEPVLFNKSIKDNIVFGREQLLKDQYGDRSIDELINEACNDAYASDFIESFQEKYQFIVGIKGSKLSGGQKQRIAIARAILCKPKILILDEATSALDNKSEQEVQKALDRISQKNVTTIVIAHRLSTIINSDIIYAIQDGKIVEQGTHSELLSQNGYYSHLFKSQISLNKTEENFIEVMSRQESLRPLVTDKDDEEQKPLNTRDSSNRNNTPKDTKSSASFGKIISLLKNNKCDLFLGLLGAIGKGSITPVDGWIVTKLINGLCNGDMETVKNYALKYCLIYLLIASLNGILLFLKLWKVESLGSIITCSLRKKVFDKYLKINVGFYDKEENSPGALLTKMSIDTMQLNSLVLLIFGNIVSTFCCIIIGLALSFSFDWRLALIYMCFIPFTLSFQALINQTRQSARASFRQIGVEAGGLLSECVINSKTIFSFNSQKHVIELYMSILDQAKKDFVKDSVVKGILQGLCLFVQFCANGTCYHFSSVFIRDQSLTFEDMNITNQIMLMIDSGIQEGLNGIGNFKKATIAFKSLFSTLDLQSTIDSTTEGNAIKASSQNIKGKIEFKNVSFSYPTKPNNLVLKNINFTIHPGQSVAFVGLSGSGKSTIIQLIERFYDVQEGEILIDEMNIKEYNLLQLRERVGLVSQEPVLFKRSVYDNILYGKLDSDKDEVCSSAQKAVIEKLISQKDDNNRNDTPVSGGEKQRVAIARAFLKNPTIMLLDEATSALDKNTEVEIQKSLEELQKSRTSITIAHRMNTIISSDLIFFIDSGIIIEKGNHEELLKQNGKYAKLFQYYNS